MNPNFNSGFLQEAFRLNDENWNKYGDPNLYYNQQIKQNQVQLGQIQNIGALQANQLQQLQALKQIQDIQKAAEEERINQILYPVSDGRGNSFFANLRQMEALKTAQAYTQQTLATENLQNQQQLNSLKTAEAVDQYRAERQGTPKLMDFKDRLGSLNARIRSGGEDGVLALRELENLRLDPELSTYVDETGSQRRSKELSSLFESELSTALTEARKTKLFQTREDTIKDLSTTQQAIDEVISYRGDITPVDYQKAMELRGRIRSYALKMDLTNPDPELISQFALEASSFDVDAIRKKRETRMGVENVRQAGLDPTKVTSGPKGVEVEAEVPKAAAGGDSFAARSVLDAQKNADALMDKIVDMRTKIASVDAKGPNSVYTDKEGNQYKKDQLEAQLAALEKAYVEVVASSPGVRQNETFRQGAKAMSPSGVPNVLTTPTKPVTQPNPSAVSPTNSTPSSVSTNAPTVRFRKDAKSGKVEVVVNSDSTQEQKPTRNK